MKVLIVEDHEDTATAMRGHLELSGVNDVKIVSSVLDAFEVLSKENYDWVIIDMFLDGKISGRHLVHSVLELHPETRVIVSTAMFLTHYEKNSLIELGVRTVLDKPYDMTKLCSIILGKTII